MTLNAIAGIGMLAVGILGGPVIGKMTEDSIKVWLKKPLMQIIQIHFNDNTSLVITRLWMGKVENY